jgi:TldD protein
MGDEANASGTSYINDPLAMIGTYQTGTSALTVTGNRSEPGGCATVRWDDEGVTPDQFSIIDGGILQDFQTTRESAGWLQSWYTAHGRHVQSHGCANAPSAMDVTLQHAPNLALVPGRDALDFDTLLHELRDGVAITNAQLNVDFQCLNGMAVGQTYEVKGGTRTAIIANAGILFRSPELWKGLTALGGTRAAQRYGMSARKGEPQQSTWYSVTAVPAAFKQLSTIDVMRKA